VRNFRLNAIFAHVQRRTLTAGKFIAIDRRVSADDLKARLTERDRRLATDTRSEMERWLDDPPPDRSALARRRSIKSY
jgi:hypothetical protein